MRIEISQGRFFSEEFGTDSSAIIINEAARELLGWENAVGKRINDWSSPRNDLHVIGVVKDIHYESLQMKVRPMAFLYLGGSFGWDMEYISVRFTPGKEEKIISALQRTWTGFSPALPTDYTFLESIYDQLYGNEMRARILLLIFSGLAIFIACLGLLGLASFMAEQRRKEIGIRKVFGASSGNIYSLLSREFIKWVLVANLIAWPVSWWALDNWLDNYAYRVPLNWWVFILAGIITSIITILIVSYQGFKSALANPVDSMRYE
jgi:putative ABC transport system permease protein